jgi:hypothetical protein
VFGKLGQLLRSEGHTACFHTELRDHVEGCLGSGPGFPFQVPVVLLDQQRLTETLQFEAVGHVQMRLACDQLVVQQAQVLRVVCSCALCVAQVWGQKRLSVEVDDCKAVHVFEQLELLDRRRLVCGWVQELGSVDVALESSDEVVLDHLGVLGSGAAELQAQRPELPARDAQEQICYQDSAEAPRGTVESLSQPCRVVELLHRSSNRVLRSAERVKRLRVGELDHSRSEFAVSYTYRAQTGSDEALADEVGCEGQPGFEAAQQS